MESIIEKARKILALVEQGVDGEVQAAKAALEAILKKNGLTIEDLKNEKRERREFSLKSGEEEYIFNHCIINMFGHHSHVWENHYRYKRDYRHIYAEMTDVEYLDFKPFFEFHVGNYRKELKKMVEAVRSAYIQKNHLFDPNPSDDNDGKSRDDIDMQEIYRIMSVMESMETSQYRKSLEE